MQRYIAHLNQNIFNLNQIINSFNDEGEVTEEKLKEINIDNINDKIEKKNNDNNLDEVKDKKIINNDNEYNDDNDNIDEKDKQKKDISKEEEK